MDALNSTTDVYLYLKQGKMTKPFMRDEEVFKKVQSDQMVNTKRSEIESLMAYIKYHLKPSEDENFKNKNKFRRTVSQIWKSGVVTGCADNALVFATMARQIGIPTTILETADKSFLEEFAKDSSVKAYRGHFFCECFYHEKWVLVDPTFNKVMEDYDVNNLNLPYKVGKSSHYVSYLRETDIGKGRNIAETNRKMIELSLR